jgi:hypothetical protein
MAWKKPPAGGYVYFAAQPPTMQQILWLPVLTQQEIDDAWAALSQGDPGGVSAVVFDRSDVALIGAYRVFQGTPNLFWQMIVNGERPAFGIALHEAAEIQAFQRMGVDFSDRAAHQASYQQAHAEALLIELGYWQNWAQGTGYLTTLRALLLETPWRQPFRPWREAALVDRFRPNTLGSASVRERQVAAEFFRKVVLQQP